MKILFMFLLIAPVNKILSQDWYNNGYSYIGVLDPISCYDKDYQLVYEDNFNGPGLNTVDWETHYPWGRTLGNTSSGTGFERQFYADANVSVPGDGNLYLYTQIDPAYRNIYDYDNTITPNNVYFKYTSGMIYSKVAYKAGKFEIRCKIPFIYGTWPAFWLYGSCGQEIDAFEFVNGSQTSNASEDGQNMITTYHKNSTCTDGTTIRHSGTTYDSGVDLSSGFHTYSVEWDATKIIWRLDGNSVRQVYRYWQWSGSSNWPLTSASQITATAPPFFEFIPFPSEDIEMNVIINTAVLYDRGAPPTPFVVDWVKVYTKSDCYTNRTLCTNNIASPGLVTSKTITTDPNCDFNITSGQPIEMKALDEITLNPGFSSDLNSDFYAHITYCEDYEVKNNIVSHKTPIPTKNPPNSYYSQNEKTNITSTNTYQEYSNNEINVYPNPTKGEFVISNSVNEKFKKKIIIKNVLGETIIFDQTIIGNGIKINISNQPKGLYLITIIYDDGKINLKKIILN
ncbi:MAG: family 16 glycosylhydrolase [Bacteroidota bacterium]